MSKDPDEGIVGVGNEQPQKARRTYGSSTIAGPGTADAGGLARDADGRGRRPDVSRERGKESLGTQFGARPLGAGGRQRSLRRRARRRAGRLLRSVFGRTMRRRP